MRRITVRQASRTLTALLTDAAQQAGAVVALPAARIAATTPCDHLRDSRLQLRDPARPRSVAFIARGLATVAPVQGGTVQSFRLAQTGEGIKECELLQWYVHEGDPVQEFQRICEVQSDKATIEITSPYAGVVKRLLHKPGDVVQVGEVLADIHLDGSPADAPDVHLGRPAVGQEGAAPGPQQQQQQQAGSSDAGAGGEGSCSAKVMAAPAVRALAQEHGINLSLVPATGPGGRLTKADVMAYLEAGSAAGAAAQQAPTAAVPVPPPAAAAAAPQPATPQPAAPALPAAAPAAGTVTVPLRGYRKAMVKSMEIAKQVPHFYFHDEVYMGALSELREALREDPALGGAKLTYMPFFIKAAALALRDFPSVNSSLAPSGDALLQHSAANIGIAMATDYGLVVPNIKHVESKSIATIAAELAALQRAAAENRLRPEDVRGGTFTVSNVGTAGGIFASPLVNPPEVAIMATGKIQRLPRFGPDGSTVVAAEVMGVSLGADHRVVDGAALAGFAKAWRRFVESPGTLLLHLA